jgi:hypothetical protein
VISDAEDFSTCSRNESRRMAAHVAEALNHVRCIGEGAAMRFQKLFGRDHHAASRGLVTADRAEEFDRFSRDDAWMKSVELGVLVHDPRHHLRVCVHIGCGDVDRIADEIVDARREPSREPFEFAGGKLCGVDANAAFCAAEWNADDGGLPRHECGQGVDLVHVHVGMKSQTAFERAT